MDYKAITKAILLCGSEPSVRRCEKECPYYKGGDTKKCIPRMTKDASAAITNLIACAESAEARAEKAERELDVFKQKYIEMTNRACELSKIVEENGLEE